MVTMRTDRKEYNDNVNGMERPRYSGGQVKGSRCVWFANRFGSMRSTGARPSLIRASAPLTPSQPFVLPPPPPLFLAPQTLLHRNSIVLPSFSCARRFSRSMHSPFPPCVLSFHVQRA